MTDPIIEIHDKPELKAPVLIEGLPGVGNVGKLAADHMVDELKAVPLLTLYSRHLPPQVLIDEEGIARLVSNKIHYHRTGGERDLLILTGDYQGMQGEGQFELARHVLDFAQEMGVSEIYTLGGYHVGKLIEKPKVLGAATDEGMVQKMKDFGVTFSKNEPGNGIVGASGLILGMARIKGIPAACLMGETYGFFVGDPTGGQAVLEVLKKILGLEIDMSSLEKKAQELEYLSRKLKEIESGSESQQQGRDRLEYIG